MDNLNLTAQKEPASSMQDMAKAILDAILNLDPVQQNDLIAAVVSNVKGSRSEMISQTEGKLKYLNESFKQLNNILSNGTV